MKKIVLDAGHGYNTGGKRTPRDVREWTLNDAVCRNVATFLVDYDVTVTRCDDTTGKTDVPVQTRTDTINSTNPDLFVSIHHNANTGMWGTWTGVEVYYNEYKPKRDADLAKLFVDEISKQTGLKSRGVKSDKLSPPGSLHMVRETKSTIPSVLCEGGFMDSTIDEPVITSDKGQKIYAQSVANICISYLKLQKKTSQSPSPSMPAAQYRVRKSTTDAGSQLGAYSALDIAKVVADGNKTQGYKVFDMSGNLIYDPNASSAVQNTGTPIIGKSTATLDQAVQWARNVGSTDTFVSLAKLYWDYCNSCGSINPVIAYVQAALETGYGKFGGVIDESYRNPCGMKTKTGSSDTDSNAHQRFATWDDGVKAHLDHLALYAGASGYPRVDSPDPRHFPYLLGTGKSIETMAKGWCPGNANYASIIIGMMEKIAATAVSAQTGKSAVEITVDNAMSVGVLTDRQYWLDVLNGKVTANPEYIKLAFERYHSKVAK